MHIRPSRRVSPVGRRQWLQGLATGLVAPLMAVVASWAPLRGLAAGRRDVFEAPHWQQVLTQLGADNAQVTASILIDAPDVAENGAYVPISITSSLPQTSRITILVENNPTPLVTTLRLNPGVDGFISTQIKMNESSRIHVIVEANARIYTATRQVKVINGGCG